MITYSETVDALYVKLQDKAEIKKTVPYDDSRIVDFAADGSVVGVEFLAARAGIDLTGIPERERLEAPIRSLNFPIFA